jgi:putative CocE/NonD family hydrolase
MTLDEQTIGRECRWWREWLEHACDDEFWHTINTHDRLAEIDVPIRQQGAWYDPYTAAELRLWNGMREHGYSAHARQHQQIWIIPWTHHIPDGSRLGDLDFGPAGAVDLKADDLRWFDYWLKGIPTGIVDEPPIKLFVMGENVWRFEHEWPLGRTQWTRYYLHSNGRANSAAGNGTLDPEPPAAEQPDHFDYDPQDPVPTLGGNNSTWTWMKFAQEPIYPGPIDQRPIERRDDVLVYTTPPLEHDLEVTGPLQLVLYAASSACDTDFTGKLVDVYPEGRAIHLAEGILRARHRTSLQTTELLAPGEVTRFEIELAPTSNLFRRGHRLRVEVSSSNFPRFDRNLNTGEDLFWGTRMEVAHQTVLHSTEYPSHILLPVIPR